MPTPSPKHDTVFQSDDGGTPDNWAALVVDDSGNGNTLTDGTTKGSLLAAAAGDFTATEWNVTIRFDHNTGDASGYIFSRQQPAGTQRMGILVGNASATSLEFVINNAIVGTMTMPGTYPASGGDVTVVSWSGRANPLTTGAANATHNEVRCWNETDLQVEGLNFSSAVISGLGTADVVFGARHAGLATQDYGGQVHDVHYGTRFRSSTETFNDWIQTAAAPALTGDAPLEVPVPDTASGFGAEDWLAGPVYALSAAATVRNGAITLSPLVNTIPMYGEPPFHSGVPDPARWQSDNVPNAGALDYRWVGAHTYYCPVPHNCNRLKVYLHIQVTDPQSDDTLFRVYSLNAHPDSLELAIPGLESADELEYYYSTITIDAAEDHGSSSLGGAWYSFDPIKIARAPGDEHTLVAIAVSADAAGTDYRIRSVHVEPLRVEANNPGDVGGLDLG